MAKLLGTTPGFWYYDLQDTEVRGGTLSITSSSGKEAYYDSYGITARKDPIVLDSAGIAITYLDSDEGHTVVIANVDGNTLDTVSDVTGIPSPNLIGNNLDLNGNSIVSSSNGDITITSGGSGRILLDGLYWPTEDGAANTPLSTQGEGQVNLSFGSFELSFDSTPALGGNLDTNSYNILSYSGYGIEDDSGNKHLNTVKTTSAVNHIEITNAATGNDPSVNAAGDDTNINLKLQGKGSKSIIINDSYYLPTNDGATSSYLKTDGSGVCDFDPTGINPASQSQMETGTVTTKTVTPENIIHSPLVPKVVCLTALTGGTTPSYGYNCSSHTSAYDTSLATEAGIVIYFDVTMANTDYVVVATPRSTGDVLADYPGAVYKTTTSCLVQTRDFNGSGSITTKGINVMVYGDLA